MMSSALTRSLILAACAGLLPAAALAQQQERRPPRVHTATQAEPLILVPATTELEGYFYAEQIIGDTRVITANGLANHLVGTFPNPGNPTAIRENDLTRQVPLVPSPLAQPMYFQLIWDFGITRSATVIDPLAAEFWQGDRNSGWQYEALGGAVQLGLDTNHAHVQPDGTYHYHGWPDGVLTALGWTPGMPSPLIGWAADGYPIYTADITDPPLESSYRLKSGNRQGGATGPTGPHDGAFVQDFEYVAGLGDLDECNGANIVSEDFPQGSYAYVITPNFPTYPRCFMGRPDRSFMKNPPAQ